MRERGGAAAIVPDQRIDAGPARDLIAGRLRPQPLSDGAQSRPERADASEFAERLLEQPVLLAVPPPAAPFAASELLVLNSVTPGIDILARLPRDAASNAAGAPVIVSMPRGGGRLLVSGAMDAWRFRGADHAAFDRFWQSTIAGMALAVPPPLAVGVDPPLLRPGERGEVVVRVRSQTAASISAALDGDPIRLLPDPEAGVYRGRFTVRSTPGRSVLDVRAAAAQALSVSRTLLVQSDIRRIEEAPVPSLAMLAASHRGIDVTPDRIADLERFVRSAVASTRTPQTRHPMRSAWWIVPFAGCLSAEWWLRRRQGLR